MTEQEKTQLKGFVEYYISAFSELNKLEEELQDLSSRKEALSEKIKSTREKEERLMETLKEKYGDVVSDPKFLIKSLGYRLNDLFEVK